MRKRNKLCLLSNLLTPPLFPIETYEPLIAGTFILIFQLLNSNVPIFINLIGSTNRYHFDGTTRKFFEGWYFKVSIPERRQSFCFMYSVESPSFRKPLTPLELAQYGPRFTGVGAQILGADDKYICQYSPQSQFFWGSTHFLSTLLCSFNFLYYFLE